MRSVQMEITSLAVVLLINIFAADKSAMQASRTDSVDILFIFVYNEGARVLGLSPFPLRSYFFLSCTVIAVVIIANIVAITVQTEEIHS